MGVRRVFIILAGLLALACQSVYAQSQPPSQQFTLNASLAATWTEGRGSIILLHGPVKIAFDRANLTADGAVVWLAPLNDDAPGVQRAQIALIGHAQLQQGNSTRSGERLFVTAAVRGEGIRIVADERVARDDSQSGLYQQAMTLRQTQPAPTQPSTGPASAPSTAPAQRPKRPARTGAMDVPIDFEADNVETVPGEDGNVDFILTGGVKLSQRRPTNDYLELSCDRAVLFTRLKSLKELAQSGEKKRGRAMIVSTYIEGDVRIDFVPAKGGMPEQRLTANRAYYEFGSDRAVLTDAILHTTDPQRGIPLVMRARMVRQLSQGEYLTEGTQLSTSTFAVPSYSLAADKIYLRDEPTGDPVLGDRVVFDAHNISLQAFDVPFFFWPEMSGELSRGLPLRGASAGTSSDYGTYVATTWGLFESLGQIPPRDIDVNYHLDYYSKRGPAIGLNAAYGGGFVTEPARQPWDFQGQFKSYFVDDKGDDTLGDVSRGLERVNDPSTLRGQVLWEHQHFFPDGWEAQARVGYVSDGTFLEEWFRDDFQDGPPRDVMGYLKHQAGTEAFTFGIVWQPNQLVTTSNFQQENFEVDRFPEIGYYSLGDGLFNDDVTLFSENSFAGLHFARSRDSLASQGFNATVTPGLPDEGYTGTPNNVVFRGDLRQELDAPFTAGPFRVTPFVMGRYTEYSDTPTGAELARGMVGAGTRVTTELWKVDPTAQNDLLDIHQLRHVIEPEVNVFTSAMNSNRAQVYVYDPEVDAINDVSAAEFALHQRWQTKRGGPGEWRSVDVFTLDVSVSAFDHKPPDKFNNPYDFRGMYFSTYPEESIPRDAVNANCSWRLSDNTILLGDMSFNLDRGNLQTLALGLLVRRDERLSYFIGNRYISQLDSNITSFHVDYELTSKYLIDIDQEFDFTLGDNVYSSLALVRKFDTFQAAIRYFHDETTNESSFSFNVYPLGLGQGLDTNSFNTFRH